MQVKHRKKLIIVIVVISLVATLFPYIIISSKLQLVSFSDQIPLDYWDLFKSNKKEFIIPHTTYNMKHKNSISAFHYKNTYSILVFKMHFMQNITLQNLVQERSGLVSIKNNFFSFPSSVVMVKNNMKLICCLDSLSTQDKLYMIFYGDSINYVKNDSEYTYSYYLNNFAIKYGINDKVDLQLKRSNYLDQLKINIKLIKKFSDVYMVIMYPIDKGNFLNNESIDDFVK